MGVIIKGTTIFPMNQGDFPMNQGNFTMNQGNFPVVS